MCRTVLIRAVLRGGLIGYSGRAEGEMARTRGLLFADCRIVPLELHLLAPGTVFNQPPLPCPHLLAYETAITSHQAKSGPPPGACDGSSAPAARPIVQSWPLMAGSWQAQSHRLQRSRTQQKVTAVKPAARSHVHASLQRIDKPSKRPSSGKMEIAMLTLSV